MSEKWLAIMFVGIIFSIAIGVGLYRYAESQIAIEAAKNGLQECMLPDGQGYRGQTVWQRECKYEQRN